MRFAVQIAGILILSLPWPAPIAAADSCPGQPCVTVRFEGRDYQTVYVRKPHNGLPAEIYYYPIYVNGQHASKDGQKLWGHFARWPAADQPDQSNFQTWHVFATQQGNTWLDQELTGVHFEPLGRPAANAEAAGRALFEEALRERQALNQAIGQGQATASTGAPANAVASTRLAFDAGATERLSPADERTAYIVQRWCSAPPDNPKVAKWFPNGQPYAVVLKSDFATLLREVGTSTPRGEYTVEQAVKALDRWNREGQCFQMPTIDVPRTDIRRPTLPPSMRSDDPYGQD